jgi:DNA polymerase I
VASSISDWRDLPFREIWCVDFEFYPGPGLANGGREGDPTTPLCLVALEMRSGRLIRQWCDEFGRFPPYRLDADALFICYMSSAEYGCHIALGWGQPACALDPYIEFRHHVNDGAVKSAERPKGFYGLVGALQYFRESGIDTAHKTDMRDRIVQGPPYTATERAKILDYCEGDVRALALLVAHIVPTIRSLPHAMLRAKFPWPVAQQERRGIPIDAPFVARLRSNWDRMQGDLVAEMDAPFGIYEFDENGKPHWRKHLFASYVRHHGMLWPAYPDGSLDERDQTFRDMQGRYPQIGPLRELKYSVSKLRLNDLQIGNDGRN